MKRSTFKFGLIALTLMLLVVPVSAKTADKSAGAAPGAPAAVPVLQDWFENWDSYPTGQSMHGVGGWKGWANSPGATAYTTDVQRISLPNSVNITAASDLVHEYAITSGQWIYTAWQFVPTDFSGTSYFILLNTYNDAGIGLNWSTEVAFDSVTNQVSNDGPAGGVLPLRKGQWVKLEVQIDLDADTQAFYYGDDLLFQGSWKDGMSGGGVDVIQAVDLFANFASPVYYDDLSLVGPPELFTHINKDKMKFAPTGRPGIFRVLFKARIWDQDSLPVADANVLGTWTFPDGSTLDVSAMTNLMGLVKFVQKSSATGEYGFCITDIVKEGYGYDPGSNTAPDCLSVVVAP